MPSQLWLAADSGTVRAGLDLGTSGLKAVLVDDRGLVVARASVDYETHRPESGAAEQDPGAWIAAVRQAVERLAGIVPVAQWSGVGLSAMLPTLVCLDSQGNAVGQAITWEDSRAQKYGDQLRASVPDLYERTGQFVDGRYLLPMWMRLRSLTPTTMSAAVAIAGAKDYLVRSLTGQLLTDPSTAAGFGCFDLATGQWLADVLVAADCDLDLPHVVASDHMLPVSADGAELTGLIEGLPLAVGAADSVLGALGMGATQPGDVAYVAGSSTVILGVSQSRPVDAQQRFIVTPMAHSGSWGLEMDLMSTGGAIRWAAQLFGFSSVEQAMTAARVADSLKVPSVLPYVSPGEQGALWDANLTGVVAGLNLSHTAGDVMRGIIDGIVVESRRCVEVLREYGCQASTILVAGGSALDPWFRQLLADACGALVVAPTDGDSDYSAIGAALLLGGPVASGQRSTVHPVGDENYWEQRLADADALRHAVRTVPKPLTDTKGSGSLRSW